MSQAARPRTPPVVAIVGPTAVGKSTLALQLAPEFGAGILSADSRQVYRYMDVGTAKPTLREQALVTHYMIDVVEPSETYSAQRFATEAARVLIAHSEMKRPIFVVGGTGFYVSALLDGLSLPSVAPNPALRARFRAEAEADGPAGLHRRLQELDPASAARIHWNNLPRLVRALEIVETLGGPVPSRPRNAGVPAMFVGLNMERETLYEIADRRIQEQMRLGLQEETARLLRMGYSPSSLALGGLGYREMVQLVQGRTTQEEAVASYQAATRRYIRRQLTWFRGDSRINWVAAGPDSIALVRHQVERYLATAWQASSDPAD
ncbi:MAG TPA: tRNA (adenosine(37)-N6)-dimethylallyltransferase MiaA [Chloroflexota bacterium]